MTDVSKLADTARHAPVAVIGAGIAGLVAGFECAKLGMPVTVFEAEDAVGGAARTVELGGARVDVAASGFSDNETLNALITELGLENELIEEAASQRMTVVGGALVPLPAGVLGIPANPFLQEVVRVLGWGGAWRAYLDRLRPPLTIGHERRLAKLVGGRMGQRVLDRLVTPRTRGGFGVLPDEVDVEAAAPGLNAALTTQGSLTGAASVVLDERPPRRLRSFRAGIGTLAEALAARITELGGEVRTGVVVTAVERVDDRFRVIATRRPDADHDDDDGDDGDEEVFAAMFVATDETHARGILAPLTGIEPAAPQGASVDVFTAVIRPPAGFDVGAGVFTGADERAVWSVDDETARWQRDAPADARVVRAVLPGTDGDTGRDDAQRAVDAVDRVVGGLGDVLSTRIHSVLLAPPSSVHRFADRARAVRSTTDVPGIGVVGAWVAGAGIASVVADAEREAERVRAAVLFEAPADG